MNKALCLFLAMTATLGACRGEILVNLTNQVWRYDESGTDLTDTGWQNPGYDDSSWLQGRGVFAAEISQLPALFTNVYPYTNTVLSSIASPRYFRARFNFAGNPAQTALILSNLVDDGYIAFLNGVEISVYNMNANGLQAAASNPGGEGMYVVADAGGAPGPLQNGENVLAVAVYNGPSGSDMVWGTVLHAIPAREPIFLHPAQASTNAIFQGYSTNLLVRVDAAPSAALQWFKDGEAIPHANDSNYLVSAMTAGDGGTYWCVASNGMGTATSPIKTLVWVADYSAPGVVTASTDPWDLKRITLTFSEVVVNAADPFSYYLENIQQGGGIGIASAGYGAASNVVVLQLAQERDPVEQYAITIVFHTIEDRFGNPLADPAVVRLTVPAAFQQGLNGYAGTLDVELAEIVPDQARTNRADVRADLDDPGGSGAEAQGLLRFDGLFENGPNQIPFGATINNARLQLYTIDQGSLTRMLRMLVPWDQQSTWNSMRNGIDETNHVEAGLTEAIIDTSDEGYFDWIDVTATVQAWANGEPNYGWAFLATGPDAWAWASSENAQAAHRPALVVDYWFESPMCSIAEEPVSTTVWAGQPIELRVHSFGSQLQYQWFKNSAAIPGAISSTYWVPQAHVDDAGFYFVGVRSGETTCTSSTAQVRVHDQPLVLGIMRDADDTATISWSARSAILQSAPRVQGPWTDVSGTSPVRVSVGVGTRFYRLR